MNTQAHSAPQGNRRPIRTQAAERIQPDSTHRDAETNTDAPVVRSLELKVDERLINARSE